MSKEHCRVDSVSYSCTEPTKAIHSKMAEKSSSENLRAKVVDAQVRGVFS